MTSLANQSADPLHAIVLANGEGPGFEAGDKVRVMTRSPVGHYRVPQYLRGKTGVIVSVVHPMAVDNEKEAYGQNAGSKGYYYRTAFPMHDVWPGYIGAAK